MSKMGGGTGGVKGGMSSAGGMSNMRGGPSMGQGRGGGNSGMSTMEDMRMGGGRDDGWSSDYGSTASSLSALAPNQRSSRSSSRQQRDVDPFGSVVDNYDDYYTDATSSLKYLLPPTTKNIQYKKTMTSGSSAYSGVQSPSTFTGGPSGSRWDGNEIVLREVEPRVYAADRYGRSQGGRIRNEGDGYDRRGPRYEAGRNERRPRGRGSEYEDDRYDSPRGRGSDYEDERYDGPRGRGSEYEDDRYDRPRGRGSEYEDDRYDRPRGRGSEYEDDRYDRPRGRGSEYEDDRYDRLPGRGSRYEDDRYDRPPGRGSMYEEDRYDDRSRRRPIYEEDEYDRAPRRGSTIGEFGGHERQRKRYAEDRNDRDFYKADRSFGRNMKYVDRRR
jgi:hypothetical protein